MADFKYLQNEIFAQFKNVLTTDYFDKMIWEQNFFEQNYFYQKVLLDGADILGFSGQGNNFLFVSEILSSGRSYPHKGW